jgi:hypothetical protein
LAAAGAALAVLAAAASVASGSGAAVPALGEPTHLKAFQLRLGDATGSTPVFTQTPSFAWNPVRGASHYEFELAANKGFDAGNGLLYASTTFRTPVASIPISLPWIVDRTPDVLYWRVRALNGTTASAWSAPAGFRMHPDSPPVHLPGGPGYVKWAASPGASGYDVWFVNLRKIVSTPTTMADLRDYYYTGAPTEAIWRVRAQRRSYGSDVRALPLVSYGQWSPEYHTAIAPNTAAGLATLSPGATSRVQGPTHTLMPVFLFPDPDTSELKHVYVATDSSCTKIVYNSAILTGGAFAPRSVQYAQTTDAPVGVNAGPVFMQDGMRIRPTESGALRSAASAGATDAGASIQWADVALPGGKYYWTVVPVVRQDDNTFHDLKSPRAACAANRATFTEAVGVPVPTRARVPFATGLSPSGRLASATSASGRFYGPPVVAWAAVPGAAQYQVEWSRSTVPWQRVGVITTYANSVTLPLGPGMWWYRVRVLDGSGATPVWSAPVELQITTPTFSVIG